MIEIPQNIGTLDDSGYIKMQRQRRDYTGEKKWKDIQDLINRWATRRPEQAMELEQAIKEARLEAKITGGEWEKSTDGKGKYRASVKIGVMIHPELMNYIQVFYPDFMDSKEDLNQFKFYFPKFCIAKKDL